MGFVFLVVYKRFLSMVKNIFKGELMKFLSILFLIATSPFLKASFSRYDGVIYGEDSRQDVFETNHDFLKTMARSMAAQIPESEFSEFGGNHYTLLHHTMADEGKCSTERFFNQQQSSNCTGFLITSNLLVTAGHCVRNKVECQRSIWVFDYANYESEQSLFTFKQNQVYRCKKIIKNAKDETTDDDYAVIEIDRKIVDRPYFKMRRKDKISSDAILTVMGFSDGLPLKISSGAVIRDNSNPYYFRMNSDTYGGNSGSPVIDEKTGLVEGILVRGDTDFTYNTDLKCSQSVVRGENEGRGEDATRVTNIKMNLK